MAIDSLFYQLKGFPDYEVSTYGVIRNIKTREPAEILYNGGNYVRLENSAGGYAHVPTSDIPELIRAAQNG